MDINAQICLAFGSLPITQYHNVQFRWRVSVNVVFYGMLFMENVSGAYQCKSFNHNARVLWLPSYWSKSKEPLKSLRYYDPLIWFPPSMSSLWVFYSWVGDEGVVTRAELSRQISSTVYCHQQCTKDTFKPNSFLLVKLIFFHPQSKFLLKFSKTTLNDYTLQK